MGPCAVRHDAIAGVAAGRSGEIFKKTPSVADSKPGGRDLAKDLIKSLRLPFQNNAGISLRWKLHSPQDGNIIGIDAVAGILNANLTDAELAGRKTTSKQCATDPVSGVLWNFARQVGSAVVPAGPSPIGAHEKQCYADV